MITSKKIPHLEEEEIAYFYSLLQEEITNYDCGTLCRDANGGVPFCCSVENAVPFLYKAEFSYLKKRTDLWKVWKPQTKQEKQLQKSHEDEHTIFCECKGVEFCERENRSISCRTFPLEPYIDKRGVFVGLVFMREFKHGCPLTQRVKDIRQEFIDANYLFWKKLMLRKPNEYETYRRSSIAYRKHRTKTKEDFHVFFPSHLLEKTYLLKYI